MNVRWTRDIDNQPTMPSNIQRVFRGISKRAREALARSEGFDVEFKQSLSGLEPEDIVAFANSEDGGMVLVGIEEIRKKAGVSTARVIGCQIGDKAKQTVLSRAQSCTPPVEIEVFVENTRVTPFFRIEIPSGKHKPYCTSGGTYKIRGDGRNKALPPGLLLSMFVEKESHQFLSRFRAAAEDMERELQEIKDDLQGELTEINQTTVLLHDEIETNLSEIGASTEVVREDSETTSMMTMEIYDWTKSTSADVNAYGRDIEAKIDALLVREGIPDPTLDRDLQGIALSIWGDTLKGVSIDQSMKQISERHPAATGEQLERIRAAAEEIPRKIQRSAEDL